MSTYLRPVAFAPIHRGIAHSDRLFCHVVTLVMSILAPIAMGEVDAATLTPGMARKLSGAFNRTRRRMEQGLRKLRRAEWKAACVAKKRELLDSALIREMVTGELGGERALKRWETRSATHRRHLREIAAIREELPFLNEEGALWELRRRVRESQPMPRNFPPATRAGLDGLPPPVRERIVHPDIAFSMVANSWGKRDFSGWFALAPVPCLVGVERGGVRTCVEIDGGRYGFSFAEQRAQIMSERAEERADARTSPNAHLDPNLHSPIYLTADELRRGWRAHIVDRPQVSLRRWSRRRQLTHESTRHTACTATRKTTPHLRQSGTRNGINDRHDSKRSAHHIGARASPHQGVRGIPACGPRARDGHACRGPWAQAD